MSSGSTTARPRWRGCLERPAGTPGLGHAVPAHEYLRRCMSPAAPSPPPAGRRASSPMQRGDRLIGRLRALPEEPLLRRIRLRLGLGRRLPPPRPGLLPEAAGRRALHPGARQPPAGADEDAGAALLAAVVRLARDSGACRRLHVLFVDEPTARHSARRLADARRACSSTGRRMPPSPASDFTALLARLQRDKRKKIQQERRRVAEPASLHRARGRGHRRRPVGFFHRCYTLHLPRTTRTPYLTRDFFTRMARRWPQHWVLFVARIAGSRSARR
jgi:hypothetical protein